MYAVVQDQVTVKEFMEKNSSFFHEPVVKGFFKEDENLNLLELALGENAEADHQLNHRFQQHLLRARMAKYVDRTCHFYLGEFQKKRRLHRNQLLISFPSSETTVPLKNQMMPQQTTQTAPNTKLEDQITHKELFHAFQGLGIKTKRALNYAYVDQLTTQETAEKMGCSQQNVSRLKLNGLKQLKEAITHGT